MDLTPFSFRASFLLKKKCNAVDCIVIYSKSLGFVWELRAVRSGGLMGEMERQRNLSHFFILFEENEMKISLGNIFFFFN